MSHPAQSEAQRRYAVARGVWRNSPAIRDAAALLGMSEREYCDAYVSRNYGALMWTGSTAVEPVPLDIERAYREAKA
jgi:hypothetical protein